MYFYFWFFFALAILNPIHFRPWASFLSEYFAFISLIFIFPLFFRKKLYIQKITLPILIASFIPLLHYLFGKVFYFSNAFLSFIYMFCFWITIIIGYNLCLPKSKYNNFYENKYYNPTFFLTYFLIFLGFLSSLIAILQWLSLDESIFWIAELYGNRPYANLAQTNQLSTFLILSLISCWYLFEKKKFNNIFLTIICAVCIFSIALTQSRVAWLNIILIIIFYMISIKKYSLRLERKFFLLFVSWFVFCIIFLPTINSFLSNFLVITPTPSVVARASSGYQRLEIWNQMFHALLLEPWTGYGWHQTTAAQFSIVDQYPTKGWASSAHNLFIDLIIWCGIPIGLLLIIYIFYLYIKIIKNTINTEGFISIVMISVIGIHSMFEYPLYYSYFLFLVGFLIGIALSQISNTELSLSYGFSRFIFLLGLITSYCIYQEYNRIWDNIIAGQTYEMNNSRNEVDLPYKLYLFDMFDARAAWIAQYPKMKVSSEKLIAAEYMVKTYLTPYDIHKYASLLAYNGYELEAKRQLKILEVMYGQQVPYQSLFERNEK
ncbi:O-antigen ligase C-terminal domain-containing protein [Acinetobacter pittii]|uniref:PglL family O-oligosaccharyltransferase n=1 Tax=Acinetobacter pittii TaxID=48296 RepID=UPI00197D5D8D|nr:O-antigen ligase family protein [Acinetobacter pittii]MBN6527502.1 O-antigen ligase C-terminal domain-containing protein [Acinetobacter pittii]MBN6536286.1 O-antigen ligase C-terminal domain-containing protein [Acinetobacter pittii]MEB6671080.1 Wzy polymerase domain-containing protein [Acinetobacter pittii]